MSRHKINVLRTGFTAGMDWEASYLVTFEFRKGSPTSYYATSPGWADEVEAVDIKPEIGSLDSREKAEALDWANEWLQCDGYDEALAVVAADDERAREYAAESRPSESGA